MSSKDDTQDQAPPPAAPPQPPAVESETAADNTPVGDRRPGFRPDVEGLRAVAVITVVLFHCRFPGFGGGFVGVDVFFVISGFLITGLLWREVNSTGTVRLRAFFGARARRLLPASALVGVVTVITAVMVLNPLQARTVIGDFIASALYVGNYRFALQGVDYQMALRPPSPFQHYWSLGVEEQFYLLWPVVIIGTAWLILRARRRSEQRATSASATPYLVVLGLIGAAAFALSFVCTNVAPSVAFFSLPTRAWELAVGGLVALTATQWRRLSRIPAAIAGWLGLALILLACITVGATTPYPGTAALLPVLGTALVIGAGCAEPSRGCGRVLGLSPMRAVGRVSYSWYLWHWPVLLLAAPLLGLPGLGLIEGLVALLVSFLLAVLTLRFVENPFRYAASLRRSPGRSLALGAAATALAVCVGLVLLVLVPNPVGRGPAAPTLAVVTGPPPSGPKLEPYDAAVHDTFAQVQTAVASSVDVKAVPSNLDPSLVDAVKPGTDATGCMLNILDVDQPECAAGDTASTTTVALIGDSTAGMWGPALKQVAAQRQWRLETLSKASCPMLDLPFYNSLVQRTYTECEQWRGSVIARLQSERPSLVVLSMLRADFPTGFPPYARAWIDSLTDTVRQLRRTGAEVLVLGPIPDLHSNVPECLADHLDDATACSSPRKAAVNGPGMAAERVATEAGGGRYADLTELFCTADRCPAIVGNALVYHNQYHATANYTRLLAPAIGALADRALFTG